MPHASSIGKAIEEALGQIGGFKVGLVTTIKTN